MQSNTKNWQRIIIWTIVIALSVGSLSIYFMVIMQNNEQQSATTELQDTAKQDIKEEGSVDPTAFKVAGDVTSLQKTDLVVGTGDEVKAGDTVRVHYKGTFAKSGVKFDSSYDRGEPITFGLDGVIKGWQDGMPGMKVGGKRRLVIPSDLAYGTAARPGMPANSDLVFEIELLAVNPK